MSDIVNFMQTRHIDSFQKLRVLYFFHKHTESGWTSQQIAKQLCLGNWRLVEQIIAELQAVGLLDCAAHHCRLRHGNGVRLSLQHLAHSYEDPLIRQKILDQVRHATPYQ